MYFEATELQKDEDAFVEHIGVQLRITSVPQSCIFFKQVLGFPLYGEKFYMSPAKWHPAECLYKRTFKMCLISTNLHWKAETLLILGASFFLLSKFLQVVRMKQFSSLALRTSSCQSSLPERAKNWDIFNLPALRILHDAKIRPGTPSHNLSTKKRQRRTSLALVYPWSMRPGCIYSLCVLSTAKHVIQ